MNAQEKLWIRALAGVLLIVALGCKVSNIHIDTFEVGEPVTETQVIARDGVEAARVAIKIGAGDLEIAGGAEALMEAEFNYNVGGWTPEIDYEIERDSVGRLTVRQPEFRGIPATGDVRNDWKLAFNDEIPLDMRIECGFGTSTLTLGRLHLTKLSVNMGAGDMNLDLHGNTTLTDVKLNLGVGGVTLDLTGAWEHDMAVDIQGGLGEINVVLPADIGVRVTVSQGLGDVSLAGLEPRGDVYVNEYYDEADAVIEIHIQGGIGAINLTVAED